jgi:NAD(P)-dependent dehydrogenase (short-subunit alcohol dehydrogenase family)
VHDERPSPAPALLAGHRVLVVGASSGIGRATALALGAVGARVVAAARREAALREVVAEGGPGLRAVACDVRRPREVDQLIGAAGEWLGGLDAVVYATGVNRLAFLADTDAETWRELLDTNLVGAALVTRAALPLLRESGGRIAYLSSHSAARPWPALGAYAASKAGLDAMIAAWRVEEPRVVVTRVVVGPTITGMADAWEPEAASRAFTRWAEQGYLVHEPVTPEWVGARLVGWAAMADPPEDLWLVDGAVERA